MSKLPYMPLYWGDYLANTGHLTARQHGGYLMLIAHYWVNGGLPKENARLARIARMTPREWDADRAVILAFFDPDLKHGRIEKELGDGRKRSRAQALNGALGGKAKSLKSNDRALAMAKPNCSDEPSDGLAYQSHSQESKKEPKPEIQETSLEGLRQKRPAAPVSKAGLARVEIAKEGFEMFWSIWPHKVGKPDAARSFLRVAGEADAILAGVERYIRDKPADRPWLNPATFLNQRRWEDVPASCDARAGPTNPALDPRRDGVAMLLAECRRQENRDEHDQNPMSGGNVRHLPKLPAERDAAERDGEGISGRSKTLF